MDKIAYISNAVRYVSDASEQRNIPAKGNLAVYNATLRVYRPLEGWQHPSMFLGVRCTVVVKSERREFPQKHVSVAKLASLIHHVSLVRSFASCF